jgi:TonB family protein
MDKHEDDFGVRGRGRAARFAQAAAFVFMMVFTVAIAGAEERAVKSRVAPVYPELAKRMKIMGVVKVEATVDADGKVTDAKALSGSHTLSPAAEDAVRKWKFVPGEGTATVNVEINFELSH